MNKPIIFILDENLELGGILENYLNHLGHFRIYLGTHAGMMEELFKRHPFEMIFIDYSSLAAFNGKYRPIRQLKTRPSVTVLIHSTYDEGVETVMRKLGIKCFLKKPYELEAIRALIAQIKSGANKPSSKVKNKKITARREEQQ